MSFLYPLGLLGLIGVPILILIYILRSKYNEQTVASTYLWTLSEKFFKRRNPLSGLTGIISLVLQILTVVIISLAIARPIFVVPESASEYCFIIDASGSMNTNTDGKTDFDRAKEYIEDAIDDARLGSSYTLVSLSSDSSVIFEKISDKKLAKELLSDVKCTDGDVDYEKALSIAQNYFDDNTSTLVYFVTDKDYNNHENVEIVNISSQNSTNYAISDAYGSLTEGTLYAGANVISYGSDATVTVELYVDDGSTPVAKTDIQLVAGESAPVELSARVSGYNSFRLVLANSDNLMADNQVIIYNLNSEESYSILIVSETPFFLEAAFDALTDSVVDSISPSEYKGQTGYGLYIFHSYTPEVLPDSAVWLINSTKSVDDSGFGIRGVNELSMPGKIVKSESTSSKARALLAGVDGRNIYISEFVKYSGMYTQFTTLFSYDSNPMIMAGVNALGNREVVFAFDLHKSDLPISSDFTPLVSNLLKYSCPDILDRTDFVCGEDAEVHLTANMDSVKTISPDGDEDYLDTSTDTGVLKLEKVGTYQIIVNVAGVEKAYSIFSAFPETESNPYSVGLDFSVEGEQTFEKTDGEYDPLVILVISLAIIFTADWMVYCYEKYQLR